MKKLKYISFRVFRDTSWLCNSFFKGGDTHIQYSLFLAKTKFFLLIFEQTKIS